MDAYEVCISSLRKAQSRRRISSLKRISPANFTKEVYLNSCLLQLAIMMDNLFQHPFFMCIHLHTSTHVTMVFTAFNY